MTKKFKTDNTVPTTKEVQKKGFVAAIRELWQRVSRIEEDKDEEEVDSISELKKWYNRLKGITVSHIEHESTAKADNHKTFTATKDGVDLNYDCFTLGLTGNGAQHSQPLPIASSTQAGIISADDAYNIKSLDGIPTVVSQGVKLGIATTDGNSFAIGPNATNVSVGRSVNVDVYQFNNGVNRLTVYLGYDGVPVMTNMEPETYFSGISKLQVLDNTGNVTILDIDLTNDAWEVDGIWRVYVNEKLPKVLLDDLYLRKKYEYSDSYTLIEPTSTALALSRHVVNDTNQTGSINISNNISVDGINIYLNTKSYTTSGQIIQLKGNSIKLNAGSDFNLQYRGTNKINVSSLNTNIFNSNITIGVSNTNYCLCYNSSSYNFVLGNPSAKTQIDASSLEIRLNAVNSVHTLLRPFVLYVNAKFRTSNIVEITLPFYISRNITAISYWIIILRGIRVIDNTGEVFHFSTDTNVIQVMDKDNNLIQTWTSNQSNDFSTTDHYTYTVNSSIITINAS